MTAFVTGWELFLLFGCWIVLSPLIAVQVVPALRRLPDRLFDVVLGQPEVVWEDAA